MFLRRVMNGSLSRMGLIDGSADMLKSIANLFPLWMIVAGALALVHPPLFTWFDATLIVWGLAIIMLGMGITLSAGDFRAVLAAPRPILLGLAAQFCVMPLLAYVTSILLQLPPPLAAGVILIGCCPGGTASNVLTYISRANVALSVLMTLCSTVAALVLTPLFTKWLAGAMVFVDVWGLLLSSLQVVLVPLLAGITLHHFAPRLVKAVLPFAPLVSVIMIALISASVIGASAALILESGARIVLAALALHAGGFLLGYAASRLFGYDRSITAAISIEIGIQNSGLAVVLARGHFADPLTAVPGAISSAVQSILGSTLAVAFRMQRCDRGSSEEVGCDSRGRCVNGARSRVARRRH